MATVRIDLPDQLAQEAERAGLLSSASLEELLRQQLQARAAEQLMAALRKMDESADSIPYMSPEEVAQEIAIMRAERRAAKQL
jgi:hypothetical protein